MREIWRGKKKSHSNVMRTWWGPSRSSMVNEVRWFFVEIRLPKQLAGFPVSCRIYRLRLSKSLWFCNTKPWTFTWTTFIWLGSSDYVIDCEELHAYTAEEFVPNSQRQKAIHWIHRAVMFCFSAMRKLRTEDINVDLVWSGDHCRRWN